MKEGKHCHYTNDAVLFHVCPCQELKSDAVVVKLMSQSEY